MFLIIKKLISCYSNDTKKWIKNSTLKSLSTKKAAINQRKNKSISAFNKRPELFEYCKFHSAQ